MIAALMLLMPLLATSQSLGWSPTEIEEKLVKDGKYYEKGYDDDGDYYIYVHENVYYHLRLEVKEGICQLMTLLVFNETAQKQFREVIAKNGKYYTKGCYLLRAKESGMDMIWQPAPVNETAKSTGLKYMWWIFYKDGPYDDVTTQYNQY